MLQVKSSTRIRYPTLNLKVILVDLLSPLAKTMARVLRKNVSVDTDACVNCEMMGHKVMECPSAPRKSKGVR